VTSVLGIDLGATKIAAAVVETVQLEDEPWAETTRTLTVVTTPLGSEAEIIRAALAATHTRIGVPS
jgi:hypothetical protein